MNAEKILTPQEIILLWGTRMSEPTERYPIKDGDKLRFARAIEQAVLQSPGVQRLRDDAWRWRKARQFINSGHMPGPAHGRRIKLVETSPMYGDEKEVTDFEATVDAAIRALIPS